MPLFSFKASDKDGKEYQSVREAKDKFALYFASSFKTREALLEKLGKHKTAKACVYIKTVNDVDISVLKQIIKDSANYVKSLYP